MATSTRSATQTLTTQANERSKSYVVVDGNERMLQIYTAGESAVEGTKCTLVEYEYLNATSTTVVRMRETESQWQSAFDFGEVYPAP